MDLETLKEKYPYVLKNITYREFPEGWFALIGQVCRVIQTHNKNLASCGGVDPDTFWGENPDSEGDLPPFLVYATQVKEKWGGLRFYTSGADDYVSGVVALAEAISFTVCEQCGHPGTREGRRSTLCPVHRKE